MLVKTIYLFITYIKTGDAAHLNCFYWDCMCKTLLLLLSK